MFVLASASPRRKELLSAAGLDPIVAPQDIDETPLSFEAPLAYALRVASEKAASARRSHQTLILSADTVVALDGQILGKAKDETEAEVLLSRLSGRTHTVHTAVVVLLLDQRELSQIVSTEVRFRAAGAEEIRAYARSGEVLDKAGAYAIQGRGGSLVDNLSGSYTNVIGLPLAETLQLLRLAGAID